MKIFFQKSCNTFRFDCNIYTSADTGKILYHRDVINAIKNYKG